MDVNGNYFNLRILHNKYTRTYASGLKVILAGNVSRDPSSNPWRD